MRDAGAILVPVVLFVLLQTAVRGVDCVKVSFYGASHIAMPMQEAKSSTNIRLRFRTMLPDCFIFLAAGRTDYALINLEAGRIKFIFKIEDFTTELWSPRNILFNDLNWHEIAIQRYDSNITMQVDEHFNRKTVPSRIGELNIHFGVFLGGVGDFSQAYLSTVDNFRGCMSDMYYNNINVFKRAKERTSHVASVRVSWACAAEFDADHQQSVSFIEDDSFMVLGKTTMYSGDTWNLEFRTIEMISSVLYNVGNMDFISLEIVDAKLRLLVGKGSNAVELIPDRNVSDGKWHNVSILYSPMIVEIVVDDVKNTASFANGSSQVIELNEQFFIGGLDYNFRKRATMKGCRAAESSFRGCMKNILVNRQLVGFPDMKITQGVTVDCVWRYPCIERQPCIIGSICQPYGIDEFICHCNQAFCIKADFLERYKIFSRIDLPIDIEILAISPMQMMEGDSVFLSPAYIDVLFDYSKIGLMEAGVIFHIVQPPKHGTIAIAPFTTDSNETQSKLFSLMDLSTDKVKYTHNGNEHFIDHITMDMQLVSTNRESVPDYIQGKHRFVLHVNITPVNDAPSLYIPHNRMLRLTQGIPKVIGSDLLLATDPDSPDSSLIYTFLPSPYPNRISGKLEVAGKPVSTFSQSDINQGHVTYVIESDTPEDTSMEISIQVSDGMETSPTVMLKVSVLPLQLRMINNTGLILVHKSFAFITPWNLSFVSNSDDDQLDVKFDVVRPPQYGSIQKLRSVDSSWITVDSFTSNQMLLGQIRYLHTTDFPQHDDFKFTVSLAPITMPKSYDFRITFTKLKIGIQRQANLYINGSGDVAIKSDNLYHQTLPLPTFARNIIYIVLKPPKYGIIYVDGYPQAAKEMDSFTQQDIDKNVMRYRTFLASYSSFVDVFEFAVSVPECEDIFGRMNIVYNPTENLSKSLMYQTKEKIVVNEGRAALLTANHFEVVFDHFKELTFNVSHPPKHGSICNYDETNIKINVMESFTFDEILSRNIYYCHDDSESREDNFSILVLSDPESNFQFVCEVDVEIKLVNDNEPYNAHHKVFYIVREESKTLSRSDLEYEDHDLETGAQNIFYSQVTVPNGVMYKEGVETTFFTQEDINDRRIMIKHHGAEYGKITFIVSDGVFEVPGFLEIQASEPFLKVRDSNASVVQEGRFITITHEDLSIETNLNAEPDEIEYKITDGPNYGSIMALKRKLNATILPRNLNVTSIKNFTQENVNQEKIIYWNTEVASMDKIRYRVAAKGIWTEGELLVRIYPAAYWELLQIRRNQTLFVEESTSVIISRDILEIVHPKISPGDITYLVTTSPQHGYLEIQSITLDDEYNSKVFDQSTINAEKMFYIQAGVNQSSDFFVFDVTNGITWLRDLKLKIIIIPENLYISTRTILVEEGGSVALSPDDMIPFSEFYYGKILEYKILQQPQFGNIKSGKSSKVNRFTQKQLEAGIIMYYHNGSENSSDTILLIAVARNKESVPFYLHVAILPVNDEIPQVVTNTGLQMWTGGRSPIRRTDLMAQDYDTPADDLTFVVDEVVGGVLTLDDARVSQKVIGNFTQRQIDDTNVFFAHNSSFSSGQLTFFVTDGVHNTSRQTLYITVNPVSLVQVRNEHLHVFPLTRKQILPEQLHFKCSDEERAVRYVVTIPPQLGRILYEYSENGMATEVSEFTQSDVRAGKILYEHTHTMLELKTNDSFYFDVISSHANSLIDQIFQIDISVSSGGLLRFLPVPRISLDEGELAPIKLDLSKVLEYLETRAGIHDPELYIEPFIPNHGIVEIIDGKMNATNNRLTLQDFNNNRVYYKHDHSDTVEDRLLMSVYLLQGHIFLCNLTIPIIINPINDQPFQLITQSPHISVVEGENKTITRSELLTEDADTPSSEIIYDIISGPTVGLLYKVSDEGIAQDIIAYGNQFSQFDIDEGKVIYIHSGKAQSTTFYFKVSDGEFKPAYEIFNINILPITITAGFQNDAILVPQGISAALIEQRHLYIETNVHKTRLMYNITMTPTAGLILRNEKPVLRFSQMQLVEHEISYMQTDLSRSNDTFQVTAYISDTNYGGVITVKVIVHPFIALNAITVTAGDKIRLSTSAMSHHSSNLNLNRYNPKYTLTSRAKHGKLKKITRTTGDGDSYKDKDITSFTYKELKSGVIYFVSKKLPDEDLYTISDSFDYVLQIKSVQPAQGTVAITINSHDLATEENGIMVADSSLPINYVLIVCIVAAIVILSLILVVIIKCRATSRAAKNAKKDYPPSLPRPPDFLPYGVRVNTSSDPESIPATAASTPLPGLSNVPQCKVIPIGFDPNDFQDSESDMADLNLPDPQHSIRYPYGDDNENWCPSYDVCNDINYSSIAQPQQPQTPQGTNPLLRRNQYWV
ncbi:chondroitin sulfate proteoglycan 4 [Phlebotomus papatasi]|uniref:chondroitin sulfate proteoglycan 4 n=1 Tax=Phlebotomus papatasi TaxID=29031 RepID=UPI002483BBCF|nr:chondroitin sulfate proteoglycan 4 [Phlebotomus papatasi]